MVAIGLVAAFALAACSSDREGQRSASTPTTQPSTSSSSAPVSSTPPTPSTPPADLTTPRPTPRPTSKPKPKPTSVPPPPPTARAIVAELPRGGTTILPRYRVVTFYGVGGSPTLGILGAGTPDQAAAAVEARAAAYASYGRPVQPAMELIATVALGSPGPNGDYSSAGDPASVSAFLAVAKRHKQLLILDFQPGRSEFLPQVQRFAPFLLDPNVGVALDPEWKVGPGQRPGGGRIGSSSAASINAVGAYLSALVRAHNLPQKLFVVHQFNLAMLPDRGNIVRYPGLATVIHADGLGPTVTKVNVYRQLGIPAPPFFAGFKAFFNRAFDPTLMSPAQIMALRPRPDLISYE